MNFSTGDAEDVNGAIQILEKIRFEVEHHGEILFLSHAYNQCGRMKSVQYPFLIVIFRELKEMSSFLCSLCALLPD